MLQEQKTFEYTELGYQQAVAYLKSIGKYDAFNDSGVTVIIEANEIKNKQQFLTE